ncbi:MAG: hypothetical protein K1X57_22900 [Gemmataceae bacterium]|nr:hypothetical protein [Gemmataceae bacterium]
MTKWAIITVCMCASPGCQSDSKSTAAENVRAPSVAELQAGTPIIGRLGKPIGSIQIVQGRTIRSVGKASIWYLQVQRVGGIATQECTSIPLSPYLADFGEETGVAGARSLPAIVDGKTYEFEGYETGGYEGIPAEAMERSGVLLQSHEFGFSTEFVVYAGHQIEPIAFTPTDFVGCEMYAKNLTATAADAESQVLIPAADIGSDCIITGRLGEPLGTIVRLRGQIVDTRTKADDGISCARVLSIDDAETYQPLTLQIHPMFGSFPEGKLTMGKIYDLEGYESGGFRGIPDEAMTRADTEVATTSHHFGTYFLAYKVVEVQP